MAKQPSQSPPGTFSPLRPMLQRGERFAGRFDILDLVGRGAESCVYKVRDQETSLVLALKVYDDQYTLDPKRRQAFHREVELGAQIQHPNVVRILGAGESAGRAFILMEFLSGRTLAETLLISQCLPTPHFLPVLRQMAAALDCLHQHGVIHRDIKPGNLMFGADGALKLMDFGISRNSGESITVGVARGTVNYAAPEQLLGQEPSPASDLFALGAVSYELLTGKQPFAGQSYVQRVSQTPPPIGTLIPDLPRDVAHALERCVEPDFHQRPTSAREILNLAGLGGNPLAAAASDAKTSSASIPATPAVQSSPNRGGDPSGPQPSPPLPIPPPMREVPSPPPAPNLTLLLGDDPRPPGDTLPVMASLLSALRRITEAGDAHDPVTPETVRLRRDGEPDISRRPDLGDRDTWVISTPRYSAPELLRGETHLGERGRVSAVLYSVGLVFYEILLGRKLFQRAFRDVIRKNSELAWMEWQVNQELHPRPLHELLPTISPDVSALFERLLRKNPASRPADYREIETAVHFCIRKSAPTEEIAMRSIPEAPLDVQKEDQADAAGAGSSRLTLLLAMVAVVAAVAISVAALLWWYSRNTPG